VLGQSWGHTEWRSS